MKCPRTGGSLKRVKVGGIEVDISEQCGGVFFDNLEIEKFNVPTDRRGEVLAQHLAQFADQPLDLSKRINCPKCQDVMMMRRYESPRHLVEIDECPACAGIWLDTGELELLRDNYLSNSERANLRDGLIKEIEHRDPETTPAAAEERKRMDRLHKMAEITSYLLRW